MRSKPRPRLKLRWRNSFAFSPSTCVSGGFIKIGAGINSMGYERVVRGHDITMRRGTHLSWRNFISATSETNLHTDYDVQRCRFFGRLQAALGGNGDGSQNDPNPGQWVVHHNIFDARVQRIYNWRANPGPHFLWLNHSSTGSQPRKNYNNLVLWGPDTEGEMNNGLSYNDNRENVLTGIAACHEVFNNIVIRHDKGNRYITDQYSDANEGQPSFAQAKVNCAARFSN